MLHYPPPTHTFQPAGASGAFGTNTNWSDDTLPVAGSQILIADGKTATMTQANADTLFGSLTLGTNSIISLAAGNVAGLAGGSVLYFNNGSQLNYTTGGTNRGNTYNIIAGATAQMNLGVSGSDYLPQGSIVGDSTTVVNMKVSITNNLRWNANAFAGTINWQSNTGSAARVVNLTNFNEGGNKTGPGTTNFDSFVRGTMGTSNDMNDSGTLQLTGTSGGASNVKFAMGGNSDTIANFVIDSPTGATASAPTLQGSAALTVSGTTTFQGTAGAVNFDSNNGNPNSHSLLTTGSMTFGGTGTWVVSGDGRIRLNAASGTRTITTNTDASIANPLVGTQGFTKEGLGALTLTGNLSALTGNITVAAGDLLVAGTLTSMSVADGAELTIGSAGTAGDVLTLGAGGLTLSSNSTINWTLGTTVDQFDTIVSAGDLDLTGVTNITINGNSLGYEPEIGDTFTLFDGNVIGFDANKFVLNLPTTAPGGSWAIQEGSLELIVVPEPAGIMLAGAGLAGGLVMYRKRRLIAESRK